jgi:anthraniloyl-CoA monooxygenase
VITDVVAVSAEGRITPGCAGLYRGEHVDEWAKIVESVHRAGSRLAMRLGHAGRRGATRTRDQGADRPLPSGAWTLLAPSPMPYTSRSDVPSEMVRGDMDAVIESFRQAAGLAAAAGIDVLLVHMAHGYLLGSFLSPLSNARTDEFGGSHPDRARFPLEVAAAVRSAWPDNRPLGASIPAGDGVARGWTVEDAVELAAELHGQGWDLVEPLAGQSAPSSRPRYGRAFHGPAADRIRNEGRVPTLVGGAITTTVEVNTLLAAGRADLCILAHRSRLAL